MRIKNYLKSSLGFLVENFNRLTWPSIVLGGLSLSTVSRLFAEI